MPVLSILLLAQRRLPSKQASLPLDEILRAHQELLPRQSVIRRTCNNEWLIKQALMKGYERGTQDNQWPKQLLACSCLYRNDAYAAAAVHLGPVTQPFFRERGDFHEHNVLAMLALTFCSCSEKHVCYNSRQAIGERNHRKIWKNMHKCTLTFYSSIHIFK